MTHDINRMHAIYDVLNDINGWITQEELAERVKDMYPRWHYGAFHDSRARKMMSADIAAINNSLSFEKIVIHGKRGVKLASDSEIKRFLNTQYAEALRKITYIKGIETKARLDGQNTFDADGTLHTLKTLI